MTSYSPEFMFMEQPVKLDVYKMAKTEITTRFSEVLTHPIEERPRRIMGSIFECLAIYENISRRNEKPYQKRSREIIEELFQNANIVTSNEKASKPDFVSVVFDSQGHLVITDIVEIKTSEEALYKKLDHQPSNTLKTIESVANLFNQIRTCARIEDLEIYQKNKENQKNKEFIQKIYEEIKDLKLGKNQDVVFSENLEYRVIVPFDKSIRIPNKYRLRHKFQGSSSEKEIPVTTRQSMFSLEDCKNIVDHHLEQR